MKTAQTPHNRTAPQRRVLPLSGPAPLEGSSVPISPVPTPTPAPITAVPPSPMSATTTTPLQDQASNLRSMVRQAQQAILSPATMPGLQPPPPLPGLLKTAASASSKSAPTPPPARPIPVLAPAPAPSSPAPSTLGEGWGEGLTTALRTTTRPITRTIPAEPIESPEPSRPVRRASVIAVTSGKGGVGKSNVSVNLAVQFAAAGKDVVLLDADLGLANADVLCNVDLPANLSHVISGKKSLREVALKTPGGFRLIGGASGLARMADLTESDRRRLIDALTEVERQSDILLIDTGAGISPNVLSFTRAADHVLVVTTPEPTAITDAYAVVKVLMRDGVDRRISLLVNQARSPGEARIVYDRIAKVARQFLGVSVLDAGFLPADEAVPNSVRRRTPFTLAAPRAPVSLALAQLAVRLEHGVTLSHEPGGFFTRMSRWFRR